MLVTNDNTILFVYRSTVANQKDSRDATDLARIKIPSPSMADPNMLL